MILHLINGIPAPADQIDAQALATYARCPKPSADDLKPPTREALKAFSQNNPITDRIHRLEDRVRVKQREDQFYKAQANRLRNG